MNKRMLIRRPPRLQPELPVGTVKIPAAPQKEEHGLTRVLQFGLPLITVVGFLLVSLASGSGRSPWLLAPMALTMIASTGLSIYTYIKDRQRQAGLERGYAQRLAELYRDMRQAHDAQRRFYHYNYPDPATALRLAQSARAEAEGEAAPDASPSRLWERRPEDADFGVVRLGVGALPSTVVYQYEDPPPVTDAQTRSALKLQAESDTVTDIPVIISLRQARPSQAKPGGVAEATKGALEETGKRTPFTSVVGTAGDRAAVYAYVQALLAQYAVFHAPTDARLYVLAASSEPWQWTTHLPHCRGDQQHTYTCFLDSLDEEQATPSALSDDEGPFESYLEGIRKTLAQRKLRLQASERNEYMPDPSLPFCLLVVDLLEVDSEAAARLRDIEARPALSLLMDHGAELGAAVIFLASERERLPGRCQSLIELHQTSTVGQLDDGSDLHFRYAERGVNTFRYLGLADTVPSPARMARLASTLAPLDIPQPGSGDLAPLVPFMQLMGFEGEHPLETLKTQTWANWQASLAPDNADWLRARIGLVAGNKPRTLCFSAKRDGVHGLVAGSTGSGKSEFLISLVCAMAVTYDPRALNFVLVDYKGGGAFKGLERLPHCVDTLTNLDGEAVARMFTAINAELRRRQDLNARTRTKTIVDYRQQGLHITHQPYPFLFIIIDEFTEIISNHPEYKAQLDSIARLGRSLGVSLLLAAQRPSGVTDQMRANIKFRVCLRVETEGESREILRRPEAAYVPGALQGRGYLQVGSDELELIQVAYTGDKYLEPAQAARLNVIWPDRPSHDLIADGQERPALYAVIVDALAQLAERRRIEQQLPPWPKSLPNQMALSTVLIAPTEGEEALTARRFLTAEGLRLLALGQSGVERWMLNPALDRWLTGTGGWVEPLDWATFALRPVVGLVDDPGRAVQRPLVVDFTQGHVVVFGASGSGKTTWVRSLVVSLAATHSPDAVHLYVLDLGGRSLQALAALPHVGAVISADEETYEERVEQLMRELHLLLEQRKQILAASGYSDLLKYNAGHPTEPLPATVVIIDNFAAFQEVFGGDSQAAESVLSQLEKLAREARTHGIHFVLTAQQPGAVPGRLYSLCTERFALRLAERADYSGIVGAVETVPTQSGRGYVNLDHAALNFLVALPFALDHGSQGEPATEPQALERLAEQMRAHLRGSGARFNPPIPIGALPRVVLYKELFAQEHQLPLDSTFPARLRERVAQLWRASVRPEAADWLKVTLGLLPGYRPRTLYLEANHDGVHGLIAGYTGSGKSELLTTLIVGLALTYSPDILNFVLVDYKGGGAFKPFAGLPHCVDLVTNLDKAAVHRMFTAINAEIDRRQKLNSDAGVTHIVQYRERGYHQTREPYPHLVIIIDEYAEMISDNPDYRAELERIARVGRSLGINLILASQQPTQVTDQMRANIKLRLCLRVQDPATSQEVLRRPDAAGLPNGLYGRGYLQAGTDSLELIQVAWVGEEEPEYGVADVQPAGQAEKPKFFEVAVRLAAELAAERKPRKPWPPFLPNHLTLQSLVGDVQTETAYVLNPTITAWLSGATSGLWPGLAWGQAALRPRVGLVDDPAAARQYPLQLSLDKKRLLVLGDAGSGKTVFLHSLIVSLATTHSPSELHMYIVDLAGHSFQAFETLPHVGAVLYRDEDTFEERFERLLDKLSEEADARLRRLSETSAVDLAVYNQRHPDQPLPAILVVMDNVAALREHPLLDKVLIPLLRRSLSAGITFAVTANTPGNLTGALLNQFGERLTFRQSDPGHYLDIVGRGAVEIGNLAGRGYIRVERQPLLFQAALPLDGAAAGEADPMAPNTLRLLVSRLAAYQPAPGRPPFQRPASIGWLPDAVSLSEVLDRADPANPRSIAPVLGLSQSLQPATVDLKQLAPHFVIAGPPSSGKTTALYTWALSLASRYPPERVALVLIDFRRRLMEYGGECGLDQLPHVLTSVDDIASLEVALARLEQLVPSLGKSNPSRAVFVLVDNFEEMDEELDRQFDLVKRLAALARRYGRDGLHFVIACGLDSGGSELKRRIKAANLGIGLRTAQAAEMLGAVRARMGWRGRELPRGRGNLVRSGEASLVQLAHPYDDPSMTGANTGASDDYVAQSLDRWVRSIQARYPAQPTPWTEAETPAVASVPVPLDAGVNQQRLHAVLQDAMASELELLQQQRVREPWLLQTLTQLDLARWGDQAVLLAHLKAAWRLTPSAQALGEPLVDTTLASISEPEEFFRLIYGRYA